MLSFFRLPSAPSASPVPGESLLHPYPILAWCLIAWNDFYLKRHHPGILSGKLSDIGICFLLPIAVVSVVEWGRWLWAALMRRPWSPSTPLLSTISCLLTLLYFSALQLSEGWASWHSWWVQKLLPQIQAGVTLDPTDLFALVMVPMAWRYLLFWRGWPSSSSQQSNGRS
ncbi:MAG: hypothetical protein H6727_02340 [Myxococcales bacterium]|nr:hypothetical protein [Myxococcales bacterium]